jgi:hypothetical protein
MEQKTNDRVHEIFQASAKLGEFLYTLTLNPQEAYTALLITLGRLSAREGYADVNCEQAWNHLLSCRSAFILGHNQERMWGSLGVPREGVN